MVGHGRIGNDFPVNPGLPTYCDAIPQHDYDPEKAKWHWDKTGLSSIELAVANAAHSNAIDASTILQEHAREAGISIELNRVPDDGYWSHTWMQVPFCATGWNSRPTADAILTIAHACGGSWNETFWCNERFDELLVMGRLETDDAKRLEIYCEACPCCLTTVDCPWPFFMNYIRATTYRRIQNYRLPALSRAAPWHWSEGSGSTRKPGLIGSRSPTTIRRPAAVAAGASSKAEGVVARKTGKAPGLRRTREPPAGSATARDGRAQSLPGLDIAGARRCRGHT